MKSIIFLTIVLFNTSTIYSQSNYLGLIEPSIGLSQTELKIYLRGVLKGKEPATATNTNQIIYTIENVDMHAEFNIIKDSCLSGGIRFKNQIEFQNAKNQIESSCPEHDGLPGYYYKINKNKKIIYFIIKSNNMLIILMERNYLFNQNEN